MRACVSECVCGKGERGGEGGGLESQIESSAIDVKFIEARNFRRNFFREVDESSMS